jgi:hypothetical protein
MTQTKREHAMDTFAPMINLLVLMSVLSVAAERLANLLKLRDPGLREKPRGAREEKERERRIAERAMAVSILLALVVKADFFEILAHLDAPWRTLGWMRAAGDATEGFSVPALLSTLGGAVVSGVALGFGSKFWHDTLDLVQGMRGTMRGATNQR